MPINTSYDNWTIITDEQDENFYFEHNESGTRVELLEDGTVKSAAADTSKLVIGGTLYEEDDNSPIDSSDYGTDYALADAAPEVKLLPSADAKNLFGVRVNGDSDDNYDYVRNDGTSNPGENRMQVPTGSAPPIHIRNGFDEDANEATLFNIKPSGAVTDAPVYGKNTNITSDISSVELAEYTGTSAGKYRIFRRDMS